MSSVHTKIVAVLALVLGAACCLTGCGEDAPTPEPRQAPEPQHEPRDPEAQIVHDGEPIVELAEDLPVEGEAVYRVAGRPTTLNPLCRTKRVEDSILRYHVNLKLLVRHPEELEPIPWLAEQMPKFEEKGRLVTFVLRKEARWPDGSPVTSADAVASWQLLREPALEFATRYRAAELGAVKDVRALDERRFVVEFAAADAIAPYAFGLNFEIVPKASIPKNVADFAKLSHLPGSGPYRVVELDREGCLLEREDHWWGDELLAFKNRWRLKRFRYKVVGDSVQAVEQLRKGLIDFSAVGIPAFQALMKEADEVGLEGAKYYLSQFSMLGFNCEKKPFDDARVRRAIAMLVPRARINEQFYGGIARSISGPFFADGIYADATIEPPPYSVRKAQALLKEAGFEDRDGDGRLDRDGKAFSFTLSRSIVGRENWSGGLVEAIRENLAQIGITMRIEDVDQDPFWKRCAEGDFEAYVEVWGVDPVFPQADVHATYHSSQIGNGGSNWQRFRNAKLDDLLDDFRQTRNDVLRVQLGRKIHRILADEQPMIFLFNNPACVVWNRRLAGVHAHLLGVRQWEFRIAH